VRALRRLALVAIAGAALVQGSGAFAADREEAWIPEPMPRGFHVESSPMDGPVFANAEGRTRSEEHTSNSSHSDRSRMPSSA
jgi:hypothetical protein